MRNISVGEMNHIFSKIKIEMEAYKKEMDFYNRQLDLIEERTNEKISKIRENGYIQRKERLQSFGEFLDESKSAATVLIVKIENLHSYFDDQIENYIAYNDEAKKQVYSVPEYISAEMCSIYLEKIYREISIKVNEIQKLKKRNFISILGYHINLRIL